MWRGAELLARRKKIVPSCTNLNELKTLKFIKEHFLHLASDKIKYFGIKFILNLGI